MKFVYELAGKEERRNESEFRMNEVWMIPEAFEWYAEARNQCNIFLMNSKNWLFALFGLLISVCFHFSLF